MKKLLLILPALALAACAPAQGAKPLVYQGESGAILSAVAQLCPTLQPNRAFNFFSVAQITPTGVICKAGPIFAATLIANLDNVTLSITALPNGNTTTVAGFQDWGRSASPNRDALDALFRALDTKFNRVQ